MTRRYGLILDKIKNDPRNETYTRRGIPPIMQISRDAKILIIGQAPGKKVEESRIPFNDRSGETLRNWMNIDKERFYSEYIAILPMDFYYPGKAKTGDLPPRKFIAEEYHASLIKRMPKIELTVLVGKYAMDYYLGKRMEKNLTETVRCYEKYLPEYFPIVHPSPLNFRWQRKNPWFAEEVIPVLGKKVSEIIEY